MLTDKGTPFDPTQVRDDPGELDPANPRQGRFGLRLIRAFTDRIEYAYDPAVGNVLRLYRRCPRAEDRNAAVNREGANPRRAAV